MNKIPSMFFFGKSLQAAALAVVALSLYVGTHEEGAIKKELTMLCLGIVLFLMGRFSERFAK